MRLKVSSAKWRPFCLGLTELSMLPPIGKGIYPFQYTMYTCDLMAVPLCLVETQRDAGVNFDEDMAFWQEINLRATKANNTMDIIRST